MFEQEKTLPGAEGHFSVDDGDDFGGSGQCHADVGRHVVWAFVGVDEVWGVLGDEVVEEVVEVGASGGVRIFHDDEAGAGVLDKNGGGSGGDIGFADDSFDVSGDFIGALAVGFDDEGSRVSGHFGEKDSRCRYCGEGLLGSSSGALGGSGV